MQLTVEEFWETYINNDISEIFDVIYDFFSNELPEEFMEDYDVDVVILDTKGHYEIEKEFDKVIKFLKLIQEKHPELYIDNFPYLDSFLLEYHCFHGNKEEVEKFFSNFMKHPFQDFQKYSSSFNLLLFYNYTDLLSESIEKTETIEENNIQESTIDLLELDSSDFSNVKSQLILEEAFLSDNFNRTLFLDKLSKYDLNLNEDCLSAIEKGMQAQMSNAEIANCFQNDRANFLVTLKIYFLKYMHSRKVSFVVGEDIWSSISFLWPQDNSCAEGSSDTFFDVLDADLETLLSHLQSYLFQENTPAMLAALWGSVYIYEFLKSVELISQRIFDKFIETTRVLKGKLIVRCIGTLWSGSFIHSWDKPDSISIAEFTEEEKIFKKSHYLPKGNFIALQSEIADELENIGDLSSYILAVSHRNEVGQIFKNEISDTNCVEQLINNFSYSLDTPYVAEKKVGRNEPCPCESGKKYKKCCGK